MSLMRPRKFVRSLLLIEQEDAQRRRLQLLLTGQGYHVHAFSRMTFALTDPAALATDLLVIDSASPEGDAIDALRRLSEQGWCGQAVLIASEVSTAQFAAARSAGFDAVLAKPVRDPVLLETLVRAGTTA